MPMRWNGRYLILFCLLIGKLALTACGLSAFGSLPRLSTHSHVTAALASPCTWHAYRQPLTAT